MIALSFVEMGRLESELEFDFGFVKTQGGFPTSK